MQIVVPMAGLGRRFADAGYVLPKPLIPVSGLPMVVRAVQGLPAAERIVFVCHPQHLRDYPLDATLRELFPQCCVIATPGLTAGQACTVRFADDLLDPTQPVIVAACDNTHLYDHNALAQIAQDPAIDAAVWTYRGEPRVLIAPQMYGWVKTIDGLGIEEVSVKHPISAHPIEDHVVSGTFYFRQAGVLMEAIDALVTRGERVNGEYYMDSIPNILRKRGRRSVVFEVDKYIGWGTPSDLNDYERWERYFNVVRGHS